MGFSGSVTALAAGPVGRLLPGSNTFEMRILVKIEPDIRMAGPADVAADKLIGAGRRRGRWLSVYAWDHKRRQHEQEQAPAFHLPRIVDMPGNNS